jgi:hypothetical protein
LSHLGVARRDHGTPCSDHRGVDRNDEEEELLLPLWPIERVPWRFTRLWDEHDVFVTTLCVLQAGGVTT